ncbi:MAG: hypothetical protein HY902_00610, partial [Deltaproteobacteria bacterium]|nr:hypothetical protein [Deltaproteobacteria bacterium]
MATNPASTSSAPASPGRGAAPARESAAPTRDPAAGTDTSAAPPATAPTPLTEATARAEIVKADASLADIAQPLAQKLAAANKTADQFAADYGSPGLLTHAAVDAFMQVGPAAAQVKVVGSPDPIAVQKFSELDSEQHLSDPSLVPTYYNELATELKKATFTDRSHTYEAMKRARGHKYCFKGNPIPADRIARFSTRNQSVETLYKSAKGVYLGQIQSRVEQELRAKGVTSQPAIDRAKADEAMQRKAYRHLLAGGTPVKTTIDTSVPITSYGTWYHPMEIQPAQLAGSAETVYARMMRLGALQPEWYPDGTVVLSIDTALATRTREVRKPTVFDGLLSAVWTARNMSEDDYGLTGGGAAEFLESNVTWAEVTNAHAVVPNDDFLADIARVASQVSNALEPGVATNRREMSPVAELARGNTQNTSILNTSPAVRGMYQDLMADTTLEMNRPGAAPVVPSARQPNANPGAVPTAPAVAPGGAYDR